MSALACKNETPLGTATSASPAVPSASTLAGDESPVVGARRVYKPGETAETDHYTLKVERLKECEVKYYFQPKKGNIKLGVEVVIRGTSDKQVPINPFYAKLIDGKGESYASTFAGCEPELKSMQVRKDAAARGFISFEIPERASDLKLVYAPFIIGAKDQEATIQLGR